MTTRAPSFSFCLVHVVLDQAMVGHVTRPFALCGTSSAANLLHEV